MAPSPSGAAPQPSPSRRGRVAVWVLAGMLMLVTALVGVLEWRGWPMLREPLARTLSQQLKRPVTLDGAFAVRFLGSIRLRVGHLVVAQPGWTADQAPMVDARDIVLAVPYRTVWRLWRGDGTAVPEVTTLTASSLDARLQRQADGRANWFFTEDGQRTAPKQASAAAGMPRVGHLAVAQGRIRLDDAVQALQLDARVKTDEGARRAQNQAPVRGLEVAGEGRYRDQPFEIGLHASGVLPLLAEGRATEAVPVRIRADTGGAAMSFEGVSHDVLSLRQLDGRLMLKGRSLAAVGDAVGVTLPTTARFQLNGRLRKDGELWSLDVGRLHVGRSELTGQFRFDRRQPIPRLDGQLGGRLLALADLAPAIGVPAEPTARRRDPGQPVLPQRAFDIPSLRAMNARVRIDIREAQLGALFAEPLAPLRGELVLEGGVLQIKDVVAQAAGGRVAGAVRLDGRQEALRWDADVNWSGIDLARWLNQPEPAAPVARRKGADKGGRQAPPGRGATSQSGGPGLLAAPALRGRLAGQAKVQGEGRSTAALLGSLSGKGATWIEDGRISRLLVEAMSLHVAEALGLVFTGDEVLPMHCAAMQFTARDGILRPDLALVDTPAATILASGAVSLATERLALRIDSRPRTFSLLSLRTPVDIGGTFADPAIGLHPDPLGWKVVAAAALGAVAPLAALIPLIDPAQPADGGCQQALRQLGRRAR